MGITGEKIGESASRGFSRGRAFESESIPFLWISFLGQSDRYTLRKQDRLPGAECRLARFFFSSFAARPRAA